MAYSTKGSNLAGDFRTPIKVSLSFASKILSTISHLAAFIISDDIGFHVFLRCLEGTINLREKEKQILDDILGPEKYDARIRPSAKNGTGDY